MEEENLKPRRCRRHVVLSKAWPEHMPSYVTCPRTRLKRRRWTHPRHNKETSGAKTHPNATTCPSQTGRKQRAASPPRYEAAEGQPQLSCPIWRKVSHDLARVITLGDDCDVIWWRGRMKQRPRRRTAGKGGGRLIYNGVFSPLSFCGRWQLKHRVSCFWAACICCVVADCASRSGVTGIIRSYLGIFKWLTGRRPRGNGYTTKQMTKTRTSSNTAFRIMRQLTAEQSTQSTNTQQNAEPRGRAPARASSQLPTTRSVVPAFLNGALCRQPPMTR